MLDHHKFLGIIPARGGSKGIPRKNLQQVNGISLLGLTILEAQKSKFLDAIILSSEDDEIIAEARRYGCEVPFKRPMELAQDESPSIDAILHAIEQVKGYDYIVLLQVTSPLRLVSDIDACIQKCIDNKVPSCVSVTKVDKSPYWMYRLDTQDKLQPLFDNIKIPTRRQDAEPVYLINGAVYVVKTSFLKNNKKIVDAEAIAYIMPKERALDIDDYEDLDYLRFKKSDGKLKVYD